MKNQVLTEKKPNTSLDFQIQKIKFEREKQIQLNVSSIKQERKLRIELKTNKLIGIDFYPESENFIDSKQFIPIIKNAESIIRSSSKYSYIKFRLMNTFGINHCQVLNKITSEIDKIEMHHGPIFTLFDLCEIASNVLKKQDISLTSFSIASLVLNWHYQDIVQLVMLSTNVHKAVHLNMSNIDKNVKSYFLDYDLAFGDFRLFFDKYLAFFEYKHIGKIFDYFQDYQKFNNKELNGIDFFKRKTDSFLKSVGGY